MTQHHPPYKAAFIGLGAIVGGYGSPTDATPYVHAGGVLKSARFTLAAGADPFPAAREKFVEKWGAAHPDAVLFEDVATMLAASRYDVITVCVPGPFHQGVMRQVFEAKPRHIFLEKPPTTSLEDMDELLKLSRESGIAITVSYSRHWGGNVLKMADLVRNGLIGDVQSIVAYCGAAVLSFASHTTELIHQFATSTSPGEPVAVSASGVDNSAPKAQVPPDFAARGFENEPILHALQVRFSNGVLGTQIGTKSDHIKFSADVFGSKGRVRIGFYGIYEAYDLEGARLELPVPAADGGAFANAYDQIATYLDGGPLPDCSNDTFPAVNEIGFGAIESIRASGESIPLPNTRRSRKIYANL